MAENENSFSGAAGSQDAAKLDVPGYPAPPEIVPLAEARGGRKAAIRTRLDLLEEKGPETFGGKTMQKLANSLGVLSDAVVHIDPALESAGLASVLEGLERFEISEGDTRSELGFWEKMKGKHAPLTQFLDRLEALATSVPQYTDPQHQSWKELSAAYQNSCHLTEELANSIAASRVRMSKTNANLRPAHDKTLETPPEERGQETETALMALRAARDKIERRAHALRGAHSRAVTILEEVRRLAADHQELRRQRKVIDQRSLPKWEESVAELIRSATVASQSGTTADLDTMRGANSELARLYKVSVHAGENLYASYQAARSAVSQPTDPNSG